MLLFDSHGVAHYPFPMALTITPADPLSPDADTILRTHAAFCEAASPPGSCHYLDKAALAAPDVAFFLAYADGNVVGCVALQRHGGGFFELKSMHVLSGIRGRGYGADLLAFCLDFAKGLGGSRISLETGSSLCQADAFGAARRLYEAHGFYECEPFGDYRVDPYSLFMTKSI